MLQARRRSVGKCYSWNAFKDWFFGVLRDSEKTCDLNCPKALGSPWGIEAASPPREARQGHKRPVASGKPYMTLRQVTGNLTFRQFRTPNPCDRCILIPPHPTWCPITVGIRPPVHILLVTEHLGDRQASGPSRNNPSHGNLKVRSQQPRHSSPQLCWCLRHRPVTTAAVSVRAEFGDIVRRHPLDFPLLSGSVAVAGSPGPATCSSTHSSTFPGLAKPPS